MNDSPEKGRVLPAGLEYVDSWLEIPDRGGSYQLMQTDDPQLFYVWISDWSDLATFEVIEVEPLPPPTRTKDIESVDQPHA